MTPIRKRRARAALGVAAGAVSVIELAVACSGASGPNRPPRESLLDKTQGRAAYVTPATWRYHPRSEAPLIARLELSGGDELFAGERGERWLYRKKDNLVRAAARLAPETLIAILRLDDGGYLFVGQSGTGYEAREPLGPFVRSSSPVDKLARVSAAGTSLVGVTRDGSLVQSPDAGATWKPVGPKQQRFVDAMLADPKRGLALSVPEAIWETKDGGSSWTKLALPSTGALALDWDDRAGVAVQTVQGWMAWNPAGATPLTKLGRTPTKGRFRLVAKPARGPDAHALAEGRAIVLDGWYLEAAREGTVGSSRGKSGSEPWVLWRGRVDGSLKSTPFDAAAGCQSVRLAGFDRWLYFACGRRDSGENQVFSIHRSADGGKTFKEEPYTLEGRRNGLALGVGRGGALVVTGVCAPHTSSRGCMAYGIHHRRLAPVDAGAGAGARKDAKADAGAPLDGGKDDKGGDVGEKKEREHELGPSAAPALEGAALALAFSPDGRTAFAVGRRTKGTGLAVFVSKDGGQSFDAHDIEQLEGNFDDEPSDDRWARPPTPKSLSVSSLTPAEDGTVAIVLRGSGPPVIVLVDEQGRVISFARAPAEATVAGAVGARALAFSETLRTAWESLDGGASWDPIGRLPAAVCPPGPACTPTVRCHLGGCVIGSELSRIGWRGQADDEQGVLPPTDFGMGDLFDHKLRTPFGCTLDEKPWAPLDGVNTAPSASQSGFGKVAWYAVARDDRQATVTSYHAMGGGKPKVEAIALLAKTPQPTEQAYTSQVQAEGVAALRYAAPDTGMTTIKNVDVVWDNLLEGKVHRQRLADAGPVGIDDYRNIGNRAKLAQPNLLSITTGGVYLRLHHGPGERQPTLFLDGRGTTSIPEIEWPSTGSHTRYSDITHVRGAHVPVMVLGGGAATLRARREGSGWSFDALSTGLADPSRFGLLQEASLTYSAQLGGGLRVTLWDPDGKYRSSLLYPYRERGDVADAPVALPTLLDAGDRPVRCGSVTKSDTARTVVPMLPGTRHPVIVTDTTEPMRVLLTGSAVMHGSPSEPCVATFDAEVVMIDPNIGTPEQERAIIVMDDLEHSWLFRTTSTPMGESRIEYRLMSCRYDPALEPPPEVFALPGTKVKRTR